jgi:hypothetical protein
VVFTGAQYQKNGKPIKVRLYEQGDRIRGRQISQWITDWWNWTISARIDSNQTDDVYFLRINPKPDESESAFRAEFTSSATVLKNQSILFPCLNTMIDSGSFSAEDTHTKRITAAINENNASPTGRFLSCTIDTYDILGGNPKERIRMSSDEFDLEATETPLVLMDFPIPPGVWKAATDGFFICIEDLPPSKDPYILRIRSQGVSGYIVNILYYLYVAGNEQALFDFQLKPKIDKMIKDSTITPAQAKKIFPDVF